MVVLDVKRSGPSGSTAADAAPALVGEDGLVLRQGDSPGSEQVLVPTFLRFIHLLMTEFFNPKRILRLLGVSKTFSVSTEVMSHVQV